MEGRVQNLKHVKHYTCSIIIVHICHQKKVQELEGSIQQLKTQLKNKESSLQVATTALSEEKTRLGVEKEEISKKHQLLLEQERNATAAEKVDHSCCFPLAPCSASPYGITPSAPNHHHCQVNLWSEI